MLNATLYQLNRASRDSNGHRNLHERKPTRKKLSCQQGPQINETKYLQAVIKTTVVTINAMTVKVETSGAHGAFDSVVEQVNNGEAKLLTNRASHFP